RTSTTRRQTNDGVFVHRAYRLTTDGRICLSRFEQLFAILHRSLCHHEPGYVYFYRSNRTTNRLYFPPVLRRSRQEDADIVYRIYAGCHLAYWHPSNSRICSEADGFYLHFLCVPILW